VEAWHGTNLLATGMNWELGRWPPACDTKHKKHCCGMKTLGLTGEYFTGSGARPLWKRQVNNHVSAAAAIPGRARCLQGMHRSAISPGTT